MCELILFSFVSIDFEYVYKENWPIFIRFRFFSRLISLKYISIMCSNSLQFYFIQINVYEGRKYVHF